MSDISAAQTHQVTNNFVDGFFDAVALRTQSEMGMERRMIGGIDAGELRNFTAPRATIKPLGIALFTDIEWRVDKHLDKISIAYDTPCIFTMLGLRGNRCRDGNKTFLAKKRCHVGDAAKVFRALRFAEP